MPEITRDLVLDSTNRALAELEPQGELPSLEADTMSNPEWSCNTFASATLGYVIEASGEEAVTIEYGTDPSTWPTSFPKKSFVNFSLFFKESSSNHNFNVFFDVEGGSFRIQAYLNRSIRISTPLPAAQFVELWKQLASSEWLAAYESLFYVTPETDGNAFESQYVTVVESP